MTRLLVVAITAVSLFAAVASAQVRPLPIPSPGVPMPTIQAPKPIPPQPVKNPLYCTQTCDSYGNCQTFCTGG